MEMELQKAQVFYKDFPHICRLCLTAGNLISIYSDSVNVNALELTNIKVKKNEKLPSNICTDCIAKLDDIYKFIEKCRVNNAFLKAVAQKDIQVVKNMENRGPNLKKENIESIELKQFKESIGDKVETIFEIIEESHPNSEIEINKEPYTDNLTKRKTKKKRIEHCVCMYCNKILTRRGALKQHLRSHEGIKLFSCEVCGKSFSQKSTLKRHTLLHTGKLKCKICDKPFTRESQLQNHMEKGHDAEESESLVCKFCGKSYASKIYLTVHMKTHNDIDAFQCEICDKAFSLKSLLNRHYLSHPEYKRFKCNKCDSSFKSRDALRNHLKWHKSGLEANPVCDLCGKRFQSPGRLKRHLALHQNNVCMHRFKKTCTTEPGEYLCSTCGKQFTCKTKLVIHIKRHNANGKFQCEICGKSYKYKESLKQHLLGHRGEKPHPCPYCGKLFRNSSLCRHIKIHKGVRAHKCTICDKAFLRKDQLVQHLVVHR